MGTQLLQVHLISTYRRLARRDLLWSEALAHAQQFRRAMGCGASRLATAEQQRDEQKDGAAPRDELGPSGDGDKLKLLGSNTRKEGADPSSKALVPVVHENDPAACQNPSRMLTPVGGWSHDGHEGVGGAGSVGRDHAPAERRADDHDVGWPGRSSVMSTMEELKAKVSASTTARESEGKKLEQFVEEVQGNKEEHSALPTLFLSPTHSFSFSLCANLHA